jgi:hypothetical protein
MPPSAHPPKAVLSISPEEESYPTPRLIACNFVQLMKAYSPMAVILLALPLPRKVTVIKFTHSPNAR